MSLEKLWDLFPIIFIDNTENLKNVYLDEKKKIKIFVGQLYN